MKVSWFQFWRHGIYFCVQSQHKRMRVASVSDCEMLQLKAWGPNDADDLNVQPSEDFALNFSVKTKPLALTEVRGELDYKGWLPRAKKRTSQL